MDFYGTTETFVKEVGLSQTSTGTPSFIPNLDRIPNFDRDPILDTYTRLVNKLLNDPLRVDEKVEDRDPINTNSPLR